MCDRQTFCCIIIGLIAFVVFYEPACGVLEDFGFFLGDLGLNESSPCDPSPQSRSSCCSHNKAISGQIRSMKKGGGCLPNIGSGFVGASVASIRDTEPYHHPQGSPASHLSNKPERVLEPGPVILGRNWHFSGTKGALVVKLFQPSLISGFTLIHPPVCQIPKGFEKSAPKDFYVMGLNELEEAQPYHFGNFSYVVGKEKAQSFPIQSCSKDRFKFVEFRFLTNHGNPNYTSLYKLQIHGDIGDFPSL